MFTSPAGGGAQTSDVEQNADGYVFGTVEEGGDVKETCKTLTDNTNAGGTGTECLSDHGNRAYELWYR